MSEYCTEAIVLGRKDSPFGGGSHNRIAELFTKDVGFLEARVPGGRKITSRLSPHLDFGNLVFVRLVYKNQFTVTDALLERRFFFAGRDVEADVDVYDRFSRLLHLFRFLMPRAVPDQNVWDLLLSELSLGQVDYGAFLTLLGYGSSLARCEVCGGASPRGFFLPDQLFLCASCAGAAPEHEVVFL